MSFFSDHITKILGTSQTLVAAMLGAVATNQIPDLIAKDSTGMQLLILANILLGAAITGVGFNNTTKERVAERMETAIKAQPPAQGGFVRPLLLALLLAIAIPAMLVMQGCVTNPDGSRELSNSGKVALQEVAAIAVSRHIRESPRAAERAQKIRAVLAEIQDMPDVTTVAGLRQVVQARIDALSDPFDRQDFTRLLNMVNALALDYVGAGQLDAKAVVRVKDFLGYVLEAIPEVQPVT